MYSNWDVNDRILDCFCNGHVDYCWNYWFCTFTLAHAIFSFCSLQVWTPWNEFKILYKNSYTNILRWQNLGRIWLQLNRCSNIPWPLAIFLLLFKTFGGNGSWTTNTLIWSAIPRSLTHSTNVSKLYSSPGTSMGTLIIFFEIEYSLSSQ